MSRDALTRLFPDGKTVFIPADGQPMPGFEQARAEIEARGGEVQVASGGGIGGLFSWLFGGGGADDAEELGGQEATTTVATTGNARGGRSGGPQPQVEVADVGPEAVAKAKRDLPTGPAYASAPEPAPAAKPQAPDSGPEAVAKAKRNLPTGPAYASALEVRADAARQAAGRRGARTAQRGQRCGARRAALAAPGRRFWRPCRREGRPISPPLPSPTPPCLHVRPADLVLASASRGSRLLSRRRTRDSARPRSMDCCRRSLPPASTARRPARSRWRRGSSRRYTTTANFWRERPPLRRPCRQCRSPTSPSPRRPRQGSPPRVPRRRSTGGLRARPPRRPRTLRNCSAAFSSAPRPLRQAPASSAPRSNRLKAALGRVGDTPVAERAQGPSTPAKLICDERRRSLYDNFATGQGGAQ